MSGAGEPDGRSIEIRLEFGFADRVSLSWTDGTRNGRASMPGWALAEIMADALEYPDGLSVELARYQFNKGGRYRSTNGVRRPT